MNPTIIIAVLIILTVGYFYVVSFLDRRSALKAQVEEKKKELAVIEEQVKIIKEADIKKEKSYDEAKADYNKRYHSNDDGSNGGGAT